MGSIRFHRHWYTSSQTSVYEFTNTGIRVHKHRLTSSQTPKAFFFAILGDLKVKIEKPKNMGGLRIPRNMESSKKKNFKKPVSLSLQYLRNHNKGQGGGKHQPSGNF